MRFKSNLYLTPVRTGLILVVLLFLGLIVGRAITMHGHSNVHTHAIGENGRQITVDIGVADLRGSLP
jgi:hypothetical protein